MSLSYLSPSGRKNGWSDLVRWPVLVLAVTLIFIGLFWSAIPRDLSFSALPPPVPTPAVSEDTGQIVWFLPARIEIPRLEIDLPVVPTRITSGNWQTTSRGVSYLTESSLIGQPGNSIFYGHNWSRLLGKLRQIQTGDDIIISGSDSASVKFVVDRINVVYPTDVSVLEAYPDPTLTLYTCTGPMDSQRLVVTATPEAKMTVP